MTAPSSLGRVDSAFIFSQNNAIVTGINYNKRTVLADLSSISYWSP